MAVLISPSNNTGWGLGAKSMYGGARLLSPEHPVVVRRHYRASWGSLKGRTPRSSKMIITDDPVADVVNAIAASTSKRRGRRRKRSSKMVITDDPVADVVNAVAASTARKSRRSSGSKRPPIKLKLRRIRTRRNVYWVRDSNGTRVPVRRRPRRATVTTSVQ